MHETRLLLIIGLFALLSPLVILPVVASNGGPMQYAAYNITVTNSTRTYTAMLNETITPSTNGLSDVSLNLASSMSNFSFSKLVNSSFAMFPILPIIGNQSFSYQLKNYSIVFSLVETGNGQATVSGSQYVVTNYNFTVSGSRVGSREVSATGTISVLPSGLVDSAVIKTNSTVSAQVQLVGTNLSLSSISSSDSSAMKTATIAGASAIFGVGALVFYRHQRSSHSSETPKEKPLYHVD